MGSCKENCWQKIAQRVIFIEGENRLKCWETHFKNLLNSEPQTQTAPDPIQKIETNEKRQSPRLRWPFSRILETTEDYRKTPSVLQRNLPWRSPSRMGNRKSNSSPKKGDLTKTDNYRGIALSQISAKVFNRCILNRICHVIDKVLRPNQNRFRQGRSTFAHVLALRRIIEELKNYKKKAEISLIDFRKSFDSVNRSRMLKILIAYGLSLIHI